MQGSFPQEVYQKSAAAHLLPGASKHELHGPPGGAGLTVGEAVRHAGPTAVRGEGWRPSEAVWCENTRSKLGKKYLEANRRVLLSVGASGFWGTIVFRLSIMQIKIRFLKFDS